MNPPSGVEILTAPWTGVSFVSRIVLVLQVGAIVAGLVFGLLAILADTVFVLWVATPPPPGGLG